MNGVPFLYINLIALCCYVLMFAAFLAAKKTPEIRAFILVLIAFILWTGGSILMRLQVYPGVSFWFYVSICALFAIGALLYFFVCSFAHIRGWLLKAVWGIGTVLLLAGTLTGVFLAPPTVVTSASGTVFLYEFKWPIIIPLVFLMCLVTSIVKVFRDLIKAKGIKYPGLLSIIAGCVTVALGNMVQILPGNTFPWDTLAGILFALMLMYSLYRKRMFRMTLLVSRSVLMLVSAALCVVLAINFISPMQSFITGRFSLSADAAMAVLMVAFAALVGTMYMLMGKLMDALFMRERQQGQLIEEFSSAVTRSLSTDEIMGELSRIVTDELDVPCLYVLLLQDHAYRVSHVSQPLSKADFCIPDNSPVVTALHDGEPYLIYKEFKNTPIFLSMWEEEKQLFERIKLECIISLKDRDKLGGLVLLPQKEQGGGLTTAELGFLTTIGSIASIAIHNAGLYEQMYREARIDSLTDTYNYRYFNEVLSQTFEACRDDSLALIFLDLDDFKLYNQLNGTAAGDRVLREVAQMLKRSAGERGTVFRYSGKVFAVILPGCDGHQAYNIAGDALSKVARIGEEYAATAQGRLSASIGVCVAPYAAATARELIENADLAVFNAKTEGKNNIVFFRGMEPSSRKIADRAKDIVERAARESDSFYKNYSATIFALTAAIDAKDHYTYRHSRNVAQYASVLATGAGLNEEQIRMIYEAALLHDIGKIGIPERILSKTERLADEEYELMKEHVDNSIQMIRHLPSMDYLIPAAVGHHERWDGQGYPRGLKGEEIPVGARCLAIADAFDAMTTDRPYRKALDVQYAREQIMVNAGKQFDPHLVEVFVRLIDNGEIEVLNT